MYKSKIFPAIFLGSTSTWVREFTKNRVSEFIDFDVLFFHEIRLAVNCSFYPLLCAFINLDRHGRYISSFFSRNRSVEHQIVIKFEMPSQVRVVLKMTTKSILYKKTHKMTEVRKQDKRFHVVCSCFQNIWSSYHIVLRQQQLQHAQQINCLLL